MDFFFLRFANKESERAIVSADTALQDQELLVTREHNWLCRDSWSRPDFLLSEDARECAFQGRRKLQLCFITRSLEDKTASCYSINLELRSKVDQDHKGNTFLV